MLYSISLVQFIYYVDQSEVMLLVLTESLKFSMFSIDEVLFKKTGIDSMQG